LSEKETNISVELEYYDLAFYLTQNPLKLSAVDEFSKEITQKSDSGNFVVKSNDVLTAQILGLDIFGEMDATAEPYSISWTLNGVELGTVENDENSGEEVFIPVTTDSITLNIFNTEGILSQNNVLQAVIDITGVGKFNASFIFDVELN
jgi:hypothetical protein